MENLDWGVKLLISFLLGAVIGLEREINETKSLSSGKEQSPNKSAILGLRSFSLIAGLGAITGLLITPFPVLAGIIAAAFAILLIVFYYLDTSNTNDPGLTTELAVIYSYLVGVLVATGLLPIQVIVALTVVLILLLSRKEKIKNFVEDINKREINALVSFAILAFVILPFLPNEDFSLSSLGNFTNLLKNTGVDIQRFANLELINPFKLWFIVVLITGVDLLGYVLERTIGKSKGWLLASLVGGFVSSTATTISIAQESKRTSNLNPLLSGAVFANLISFFPIGILLLTLNPTLFISFLPILLVLILTALIIGIFFLRLSSGDKKQVGAEEGSQGHHIFSLTSALKFMGIYLLISLVSKIALELFGTGGFFATTALGALTGVDAVVINTSQLVGQRIDLSTGLWALLLANSVNLLAKSVYSFLQGSKEFAIKFLISMLVIVGVSLVMGLLFSLI